MISVLLILSALFVDAVPLISVRDAWEAGDQSGGNGIGASDKADVLINMQQGSGGHRRVPHEIHRASARPATVSSGGSMRATRGDNQMRSLMQGGEPGDEAWIDGVMDKFIEKRTKKAQERKEGHKFFEQLMGREQWNGSNCSKLEDATAVGRTCAPGCPAKGNCNLEEGRCECPIGFGGERCPHQVFGYRSMIPLLL